jgi:uncharacterized protein YecE (DUF72 family)
VARRRLRIGCSGWAYRDWRGVLYPEDLPQRRWLGRYAETFDTVEVNNTFYRLPSRETVTAWAESTPSGFTFTIKASRYLTHRVRLHNAGEKFGTLLERLEPLAEAGKLGPILWQLPEAFHRNDERLAQTLEGLPAGGKHCFEFRHPSWFCDEVMAILREHRAALAIGDHPERPFQTRELTTDWTLVRLHRGRSRDGSYSKRELEGWKRRFAQWRRRATVFAYFNHELSPHAIRDALRLSGEG